MICCLNPYCKVRNLSYQHGTECCGCGTKLVPLSHYVPVSRIGEGQYGVTYKAEDTYKGNENCAIKQLTVHDDTARESFRKESEHLQKLNSKKCSKIPEMFGYFEQDGYLYLVQEFIDGKNLTEYLKEKSKFDEKEIRELLSQLLPVLTIIHKEGIIHRDIKPDNIMRRVSGEYVLIDFGISKQITGYHIPTPGTNVGTESYAPEEQRENNTTKESSDLYSLGVVCYNLITSKSPRDAFVIYGYSWTENWEKCLDKPIDSDLRNIIGKLLKRNYVERYQTAEDVLKDLNPIFSPEPPSNIDKYNQRTAELSVVGAKWGLVGQMMAVIVALIGLYTIWIGLHPSKSLTANDYYNNGQELDGKDNKRSIEAYTKAIETNKIYTEAYIARGLVRRDIGDNENAIKDFSEAIKLSPKSCTSYAYRGLTFAELDDHKKAENDYSTVLKIKPIDSLDYNARGLALSDSGNNKDAVKEYDQAIKRKSNFWRAYINRGISKHILHQSQDAIKDYSKAIELNPLSTSAHYNRGIAKSALEDKKGAITDYSKVIEIKLDSSSAYYQRGIVHQELGNNQEAIDDYTKAAEIFEEKSDSEPAKKARDRAKKLGGL
jgi:serine/threonine protein kinase